MATCTTIDHVCDPTLFVPAHDADSVDEPSEGVFCL